MVLHYLPGLLSHALPPPWQAHTSPPTTQAEGDLRYHPPRPTLPYLPPSRGHLPHTACSGLCAWEMGEAGGRTAGVSANLDQFVTTMHALYAVSTPLRAAFEVRRARPYLPSQPDRESLDGWMAASRVVTSQPDARRSTDISIVRGGGLKIPKMGHDRTSKQPGQPANAALAGW